MRDIDLGGVYAPALLILFVAALAIAWWLDRLVAMTGLYSRVWHPALLRTSLFACVFAALALRFYP